MFDIGFWEIVLISVIGLIVLGPQRLPIAIRTVLKWINNAKSVVNSVKNEISQELELHEMNENMIKASKKGLDTLDPDLKASIDEMKQSVEELTHPYKAPESEKPKEEIQHTSSPCLIKEKATETPVHSESISQQEKNK